MNTECKKHPTVVTAIDRLAEAICQKAILYYWRKYSGVF
jgi:enterochelin esterase-like enzyme